MAAKKKSLFEILEARKLLTADVVFQFDESVVNAALVSDYDGDGQDELVVLHGVPSVYSQNGLKHTTTEPHLEWTTISESSNSIFLIENPDAVFGFSFTANDGVLNGFPDLNGSAPRRSSYDFDGDGLADTVSFSGNSVTVQLGMPGTTPTDPSPAEPETPSLPVIDPSFEFSGAAHFSFGGIENARFISDSDNDGRDEFVVLHDQIAQVWDADGLKYQMTDSYLTWTDIGEGDEAVFILKDPNSFFTFSQVLEPDGTLRGIPGGQIQPDKDSYDFNGDGVADLLAFSESSVSIAFGVGETEPMPAPVDPEPVGPEPPTDPDPTTPTAPTPPVSEDASFAVFRTAIDNAAFISDSDGDGKDEVVVLANQVAEVWDVDGLKYTMTDPYLEWQIIDEGDGAVFILSNPDLGGFSFRQELQPDGTLLGVPGFGGQLPARSSYDFNGDGVGDSLSFDTDAVRIVYGGTETTVPVDPEPVEPTDPEPPEPTDPVEPTAPEPADPNGADLVLNFTLVDNAALVRDADGDGRDELVILHDQLAEVFDLEGLKFTAVDPYLQFTEIAESEGSVFVIQPPGSGFGFQQSLVDGELVGSLLQTSTLPPLDAYDINGDGLPDTVQFSSTTVSVFLGQPEPTEPEPVPEPDPVVLPEPAGTLDSVSEFQLAGYRPLAGATYTQLIQTHDLTGDGNEDLVVVGTKSLDDATVGFVGLLPSEGIAALTFTPLGVDDIPADQVAVIELPTQIFSDDATQLSELEFTSNEEGRFRVIDANGVGYIGEFDADGMLEQVAVGGDLDTGWSEPSNFDVNGDGIGDLAALVDSNVNLVLVPPVAETAGADVSISFGTGQVLRQSFSVGDFDGDGVDDLYVAFEDVFASDDQFLFEVHTIDGKLASDAVPQPLTQPSPADDHFDFNNDGIADQVIASPRAVDIVFGSAETVEATALRAFDELPGSDVAMQVPNGLLRVQFSGDVTIDFEDATNFLFSNGTTDVVPTSTAYDAATLTATFGIPFAEPGDYQFSIVDGVRGSAGQFLDGDADGNHGGSFETEVKIARPGDTNLDGAVDFADFLVLSRNFGSAGPFTPGDHEGQAFWIHGDFDGDGAVNFGDFLLLSREFGI